MARCTGDPAVNELMADYDQYEKMAHLLFEKFVAFDSDHTCTLDYEESLDFFRAHGLLDRMTFHQIEDFMNVNYKGADDNGNGELDFIEFVKVHNALVNYRRGKSLPALKCLSSKSLLESCKQAKERSIQRQQTRKAKFKNAKEEKAAKCNYKANFVEQLVRQRSTQMLKQAFMEADTLHQGRVTLEDFYGKMYDLGYINEVTNMLTYKQFACKNVMISNLTFDNVLQIVFPSLSGAQRKILASKVKPPAKMQANRMELELDGKAKILKKHAKFVCGHEARQEICQIFSQYDENADRRLDLEEFVMMMSYIHTEEECVRIFSEIDLDKDNSLDIYEFVAWWTTSQLESERRVSKFNDMLFTFMQSNCDSTMVTQCLDTQCDVTESSIKRSSVGYS
mmetsp:Transcript_34723/g.58334  ORF Transcript_34723/g.58334 Transcript_34723/m.58334 type:complete len:395 (-) Transcript_34723:722-1906(-)